MEHYLKKIEKQPDGAYIWVCSIPPEYYRKSIVPGLKACIGIAVFLLIFGAILAFPGRDWKSFLIVAGCTAVFLLITFLVFGLAFSAKDPRERYEMREEYIKTGSGKSSVYIDYRKAKRAVFTPNYIELRANITKMRVYTPEGDFDFVRSFILQRLSGGCDIKFEK